MIKIEKGLRLKLTNKRRRSLRKILSAVMLPIMVFYMCSINLLTAELMTVKADEVSDSAESPVSEKSSSDSEELKKTEEADSDTEEKIEEKEEVEKTEEKEETSAEKTSEAEEAPETEEVLEEEESPAEEKSEIEEEEIEKLQSVEIPSNENLFDSKTKNIDNDFDNNNINANTNLNTNSSNVNSEVSSSSDTVTTNLNQNVSVSEMQWEEGKNENTKIIGPVEIGVAYKAPQNEQVTVTFTQLPANPGKLSIEEITLTEEQVASMHALSNKAYDITSDMVDGTFKYDLTLPKPADEKNVEIKFAENVSDLEKTDVASADLTKTDTGSVSASLDHFTIFVVVTPNPVSADCTGAGVGIVGTDKCFNTIQAAIDAASSGDTINVAAGTYKESNILVNKEITIQGVGATRDDVVVLPSAEDGNVDSAFGTNAQNGLIIKANNVTVKKLTINGRGNSDLTVGKNNFRAGIVTLDASQSGGGVWNNLHIDNVNIKYTYRRGISVFPTTVSGTLIENSNVENIAFNHCMYVAGQSQVINNTVKHCFQGIVQALDTTTPAGLIKVNGNNISEIGNFPGVWGDQGSGVYWGQPRAIQFNNSDGAGRAVEIKDNIINDIGSEGLGGTVGIYTRLANSSSVIDNNTISMTSGASWAVDGGSQSVGMLLGWSYANGFLVSNNHINSSGYGMGVMIFGMGTVAKPLVLEGNTITGTGSTRTTQGDGTGIYIANQYLFASDKNESYVFLQKGNSISGFVRGIDVEKVVTSTQPLTVFVNDNSIVGNTTGIDASTLTSDMNATNNWWGDQSGPGVVGTGVGGKVSTNVTFSPWCLNANCSSSSEIYEDGDSVGVTLTGTEQDVTVENLTINDVEGSGTMFVAKYDDPSDVPGGGTILGVGNFYYNVDASGITNFPITITIHYVDSPTTDPNYLDENHFSSIYYQKNGIWYDYKLDTSATTGYDPSTVSINKDSNIITATLEHLTPIVPIVDTTAPVMTGYGISDTNLNATETSIQLTGSIIDATSPIDFVKYAIWDSTKTTVFASWTEASAADGSYDSKNENTSHNINISSYPEGSFVLGVRGWDEVGNKANGGDFYFNIDRTAPTITVNNFITNDKTPKLTGTVNDNAATISITVNGSSFVATNKGDGNWELADNTITPALSDGTYNVEARATDVAGNIGTDSSNSELIIDTVAPNATHKYYRNGTEVSGIAYAKNLSELTFDSTVTDSAPSSGLKYETFSIFQANPDGTFGWNNAYCSFRQPANTNSLTGTTDTITGKSLTGCVSSLPEGGYYVMYGEYDNAARGNDTAVTQYRDVIGLHFVIDNTVPTDPGTPVANVTSPTNQTNITWSWLASNGAISGISNYIWNLLKGGSSILNGTTTNTSLTQDVLTYGDGNFAFSVQAKDNADNLSGTVQSSDTTVDNTAPTATISYNPTSWTNGSVVATLNPSESVTITSAGGNTHTFTANGTFTFEFKDAANNNGTATATVGNIDKTKPSKPVITSPVANGYINSATQTFTWDSSVDPTPGSGLASTDTYQYQIDNNSGFGSPEKDWSVTTTTWTLTNPLSDGTYYIRVRAKDAVGNYSLWSSSVKFTVDMTAPVISGVPADITTEATSASGADVTYINPTANDAIDGAVTVSCTPSSGSTFPFGATTVTCSATDSASNTATTTFNVTVRDITAPAVPQNNLPGNDSYLNTHDFTFSWDSVSDLSSPVVYEWEFSYSASTNGNGGAFVSRSGFHGSLTSPEVYSPGTPDNVYYWHVRAIDAANNTSAWSDPWKVTVDTIVPALSSQTTFSGWYTSDQTSTFNYNDTNMADGYVAPTCSITTEGVGQTCSVMPNICDKAGNCNTATAISNGADIDKTVPVTTDNTDVNWHNSDVTITLTCDDGSVGSGCKTTYYNTDGSEPTTSSATGNSVTLSADGVYTIKYFSVDNAGNTETVKTAANTVKIETIKPESQITSPANSGSGSTISINTWTGSISGTASDEIGGSGMNGVKISIKKGTDQYWNGTSFVTSETELLIDAVYSGGNWNYDGLTSPTTLTDDTYTITSHAVDVAGNQENSYKLIIVNDKTIPEITLSIDPTNPDGSNGWYIKKPQVTLVANDNFNVDKIEYQLNETSGEWLSYSNPITLDDGTWKIYYRSVDKASNVSAVGLKNAKVDTRMPNKVDNLDAKYHRTPNRVTLTWNVNDQDISQVYVYQGKSKTFVADSRTLVSINNPTDKNYTDFNVQHGKRYYYKVITVDDAGNIGETKTVSIRITTATNPASGGSGGGNGGGGTTGSGGGTAPSLTAGSAGEGTGTGENGGNGGDNGDGQISDALNQEENTVGGELNGNVNKSQLGVTGGSLDNTNTNINLQGEDSDNNAGGQSWLSRIWHWIKGLFRS